MKVSYVFIYTHIDVYCASLVSKTNSISSIY